MTENSDPLHNAVQLNDSSTVADHLAKYQWKPGTSGNPAGRPKKFMTVLKSHGYKTSEVQDTIKALLACTMHDLQMVANDPKSTILELSIAKAMNQSLRSGNLVAIELLLTRAYGQPVRALEGGVDIPEKITVLISKGPDTPDLASNESEVDV